MLRAKVFRTMVVVKTPEAKKIAILQYSSNGSQKKLVCTPPRNIGKNVS